MKNPALPEDYGRPHGKLPDEDNPTTEPTLRTVKREGLKWVTIFVLALLTAGLVALARSQVNGTVHAALVDYQTKADAAQEAKDDQSRMDAMQAELNAHAKEVEALTVLINDMDKKVDHISFTVDWMQQHNARNGTPKDQP